MAEDIVTLDGKTFKDVKITRNDPERIYFEHSGGVGSARFQVLSKEWKDRYGYNESKEAAFLVVKNKGIADDAKNRNNLETQKLKDEIAALEDEKKDSAGKSKIVRGGTLQQQLLGLMEQKLQNQKESRESIANAEIEKAKLEAQKPREPNSSIGVERAQSSVSIYPTLPGSSLRDYEKAGYIIENGVAYPTLPGSSLRDYSKPGFVIEK